MAQTNRPLTVAALLLSMFLAAMEVTAVSTAMPSIVGELGGIRYYAWVFAAYMLTSTVTVPIFGKLSDLYGRKPVILIGMTVFLLGSVACGRAGTIIELILARALQGLGAGALQPTALTIIGDIFSLKERGKIQGVFSAVWGVAGIVGPLLGGIIVKYLNWQWVFYINVPFGIASFIMLWTSFHERVEVKRRHLDFAGAATLTISVVCLLLAANREHSLILSTAGILFLVAFVYAEKRSPEPILPIDLFTTRLMAVSSVAGAIIGMTMFSVLTYLPLFIQGVLQGSPVEAGSVLTPMIVGWPLAAAVSGRFITSVPFRWFIVSGSLLIFLSLGALAGVVHMTPTAYWPFYVAMAAFGVGLGLSSTALIIAVQTHVAWRLRGVATASTLFFRTMGGTLAVGMLGGILMHVLTDEAHLSPEMASAVLAPHPSHEISREALGQATAALAQGLVPVFWCVFAMSLVLVAISGQFPKETTEAPLEGLHGAGEF